MNYKKIVIIGASGHGKVVADIAQKIGYEEILFLDDAEGLTDCTGFSVVGKSTETELFKNSAEFIIAIGNANIRQRMQSYLIDTGYSIATLIHPKAVISRNVEIGSGTVIMAGTVINSDSRIGCGCIINTGASIDHDSRIADYVHISVGAHLAGSVAVGLRTWVSIGSVISNNVNICGDCMIGAGAVVIKDILKQGTYVGIPATCVTLRNKQTEDKQ